MAEKSDKPMTTESKDVAETQDEIGQQPVFDPADYVVPPVEFTPEVLQFLDTMVKTSDTAQHLYLNGKIDLTQLAQACTRFGKPSNPSETFNRADATFDLKLPTWVFQPPEGEGLTMEQRIKEAEAHQPDKGPMTHEQLVALPPEEQKKAAKEREKAEKAS